MIVIDCCSLCKQTVFYMTNYNSLKFTTAHSIPLIQLGTLVSSLTYISLSPTKYHLSLSLVIITFVNFVVSAPILTSKLSVPLPRLLFTLSLITATLYLSILQPSKISNKSSSGYSELSCPGCG